MIYLYDIFDSTETKVKLNSTVQQNTSHNIQGYNYLTY